MDFFRAPDQESAKDGGNSDRCQWKGGAEKPSEPASEKGMRMPKTSPEQNKDLVLKAFDTLFNKRDYAAAEGFWSPHYIQHSAHIESGREGCST